MDAPALAAVQALRALSVGEILDASFTVYRKHFGTLAVIVLACSLVPGMVGIYMLAAGGMLANIPLWIAYLILSIVLSSIATGATVFGLGELSRPGHFGGRGVPGRAQPRFGAIIVCSLALGLLFMLGLLLLVVPGIIIVCGLSLAIPVVAGTAAHAIRCAVALVGAYPRRQRADVRLAADHVDADLCPDTRNRGAGRVTPAVRWFRSYGTRGHSAGGELAGADVSVAAAVLCADGGTL